jgi:preprotein translocase subunit Sss1
MWSTIVYIALLLIGIVGYSYYLYVGTRNNKPIGIPVRRIAKR